MQRTSEPARGARPAGGAAPTPVALVTGAGGGIGGAVAATLEAAGYAVLAVDRDVSGVPAGEPHRADLVADLEAAGAVSAAVERFGRLDVVVCAHGGSGRALGDGPVDECTEAGWDATLELNLRSVFLVCRHAVPVLRANGGGAIVTVASVLGLVGGDRDFATHAYAAAKRAVVSLTRAMAVTYAPDGIRCCVVCPGLIATAMSARAGRSGDPGAARRAAAADRRLRRARRRRRRRRVPRRRALRHRYRATVDGGWTAR